MADYPVNNTAYSAENLCDELSSCDETKSLGWENFDKCCSGDFVNCRYRVFVHESQDPWFAVASDGRVL